MTGQGIKETIETALRKAVIKRRSEGGIKSRFKLFQRKKDKKPAKLFYNEVQPPLLPQPGPDQVVFTIPPTTYASDMKKLLTSGDCSDVTLAFSAGDLSFKAHKVILCMGSTLLKNLLIQERRSTKDLENHQRGAPFSQEKNKVATNFLRLDLKSDLQDAFGHLLDFLYAFEFNLSSQSKESTVVKVSEIARYIKIPELEECCQNILRKEDYLNKKIYENVKDKKNTIAKELFVNKPLLADVSFVVEGTRVFGHKAVLMARSDVLAAMLGGGFKESNTTEVYIHDTSSTAFAAMLEYLYTDLFPTSPADTRQLLVLSDRFCLPRLRSLCELSISQKLTTEIKKRVQLSNDTCSDVIETLLIAQAHNATQLYKWCVFIIKTNFPDFESHEDLGLLKPKDKEDLADQRWPPQSYLQQLEAYKKKVNRE